MNVEAGSVSTPVKGSEGAGSGGPCDAITIVVGTGRSGKAELVFVEGASGEANDAAEVLSVSGEPP